MSSPQHTCKAASQIALMPSLVCSHMTILRFFFFLMHGSPYDDSHNSMVSLILHDLYLLEWQALEYV